MFYDVCVKVGIAVWIENIEDQNGKTYFFVEHANDMEFLVTRLVLTRFNLILTNID